MAVRPPNIVFQIWLGVRRAELNDFPDWERTALHELLVYDEHDAVAAIIDITYLPDGSVFPGLFLTLLEKKSGKRFE